MNRPVLAITMGDPAGVGPEVAAKALGHEELYGRCLPVVIGDEQPIRDALEAAGLDLKLNLIGSPAEAMGKAGPLT